MDEKRALNAKETEVAAHEYEEFLQVCALVFTKCVVCSAPRCWGASIMTGILSY